MLVREQVAQRVDGESVQSGLGIDRTKGFLGVQLVSAQSLVITYDACQTSDHPDRVFALTGRNRTGGVFETSLLTDVDIA